MDADAPQLKPSVLVIFGITGDLARNKVLPALYRLFKDALVHEQTYLVGTSRHEVAAADIIAKLRQVLPAESLDEIALEHMQQRLSMVKIDPTNDADYQTLQAHLQQLETHAGVCLERFFYLSIPPQVFGEVTAKLATNGLSKGCEHGATTSRLLVEKPFGFDSESAQQLIKQTAEYFDEQQLFRIDHYLAKETAQNILVFRSQNPLFRDIWNNQHISSISITATEQIGIAGRANFYDQIGAMRDVLQSHLMQLLSVTLMEVPDELNAGSVHQAKQAVFDQLETVPSDKVAERVLRGQYQTYRQEVDKPDSTTDTYASVVLYSRDARWQGIPLRLTTGKALKVKRTSITVNFGSGSAANRLQFRIQPNEGITLGLEVKQPGLATAISEKALDFSYQADFGLSQPLEAYERVLIDAMRGDRTLFATDQEVLASWRVLQPLLDAWQQSSDDLVMYANGSDGPDTTQLLQFTHDT